MRIRLERVIEFYDVLMMSEVLEDLHVLRNLLLTFDLLIEILLSEAFDGYKVTAELVLRDADLAEGTLAQFIANAVKFMSRCNRLANFLKVCHDHGHQVLLILKQWIEYFSDLYL